MPAVQGGRKRLSHRLSRFLGFFLEWSPAVVFEHHNLVVIQPKNIPLRRQPSFPCDQGGRLPWPFSGGFLKPPAMPVVFIPAGSTVRTDCPQGTRLPDARTVPAPSDGPRRDRPQPSRIARYRRPKNIPLRRQPSFPCDQGGRLPWPFSGGFLKPPAMPVVFIIPEVIGATQGAELMERSVGAFAEAFHSLTIRQSAAAGGRLSVALKHRTVVCLDGKEEP